ncbi:MAG: NADAR family protein, partial [Parachlamydiales bacterium]|nr:NADAR family protein [Parachlamydiales bacterium]
YKDHFKKFKKLELDFKAANDKTEEVKQVIAYSTKKNRFITSTPSLYTHLNYKDLAMLETLRRKGEVNEHFKKLLLATGDADIFEDAGSNDCYWGTGSLPDKLGQNRLGLMLKIYRYELKNQRDKTGIEPVKTGYENIR